MAHPQVSRSLLNEERIIGRRGVRGKKQRRVISIVNEGCGLGEGVSTITISKLRHCRGFEEKGIQCTIY